jgi:hypothetical protein
MKNTTLLTAGLVIIICSCIVAGIYNYRSVDCEEGKNEASYGSSLRDNEPDEEQGEYLIWKSIPRYLMVNR